MQHIITMSKRCGTNHLACDEEKIIALNTKIYYQPLDAGYVESAPICKL